MGKIDKLRDIELELLECFMEVCGREQLKWYASHGTLLGAVRESGFLPWDDDIDVAMPAEDFNELMAHKEWFRAPYCLQTPLDKGRPHIIRLHKNGTTAFDRPLYEILKKGGHHGICIDILPLDEIGDSGFYNLSNFTVPAKYYGPAAKAKFEHLDINVPGSAGKVLSLIYGYWNWPSGTEHASPHNWFFDAETDYSAYVKRYIGWIKAAENKRIYLFGAADSLRIWLKDFGLREQVICTYDNDKNKWGTEAFGVEIRSPAELPGTLDENSILVITSIWHREIGEQLHGMGVKDYYVFLDGLFANEFKERKNNGQTTR
ncbi:MAG: LicD family protein [Clostridiales Family XIII bacterium]|jgi:hypothetical protein|nr:LicD family protein [Clostridiales Family XIII bacterium]